MQVVGPLVGFLVGYGTFIVGLNAYQLIKALRRTPIPEGVSFLDGLRQSLTAYSSMAAWSARHPWLLTGINLAGWLLISVVSAWRWAIYSGH